MNQNEVFDPKRRAILDVVEYAIAKGIDAETLKAILKHREEFLNFGGPIELFPENPRVPENLIVSSHAHELAQWAQRQGMTPEDLGEFCKREIERLRNEEQRPDRFSPGQ